jgi:hypothetical protein
LILKFVLFMFYIGVYEIGEMQEKQQLNFEKSGNNQKRMPPVELVAQEKPAAKPRPVIGVVPRKRGGQPGNQNAAKRGKYTKQNREAWAKVRGSIKRANELVAWVDEQYGFKRKRGRPRKNP